MTNERRSVVVTILAMSTAMAAGGAGACGRTDLYSVMRDGGRADRRDADGDAAADASGAGGAAGTGGVPGTGGAPVPCGPLIDDMEDGSGRVCADAGRTGVWYAFNDGSGTQWPPPASPGVAIETSLIPGGGRGASRRAMHTYGGGFHTWGSGIGVDLAYDGTTYGLYDARAYDGITFWARSEPQLSELHVRVSTASSTLNSYDGTCAVYTGCPAPGESVLMPTSEWKRYWVPFDHLHDSRGAPLERDKLINVQFMTRDGGKPFDFWIDDLSFYTGEAGCCPSPAPGCAGAITFAVSDIDQVVRQLVGKSDGGDIACSDVCSIYSLYPYQFSYAPNVGTLDGVQCLTGLGALSISYGSIADLAPLAALTDLRRLALGVNEVTDLTPLAGLKRLIELDLSNNHVRDLRPLSGLGALTTLSVAYNDIAWGPGDDLTPLGGLDSLQQLDLGSNRIESVAPLANLTALPKLLLWSNQIEDIGPLGGLRGLTTLNLAGNHIADLSSLGRLTTLSSLDLARNQIADLGPLATMASLTTLDASGNPLGDLHPLSGLPGLATLRLDSCNLTALGALPPLGAVTSLSLVDNQLIDIGPLARLGSLVSLDLSSNLVNDLTPLTGLAHLTFIGLLGNRIQTVAPLNFNPALGIGTTVLLAGNPIDCQAQAANFAQLRARGVAIDPQPWRGSAPIACP